jgi:uncharacterized protein with GYD domain
MPTYLFKVRYSPDGAAGLVNKGGSARVAAAKETIESVGGTVKDMYFAFGDVDAFVIAEMPDDAAAAAVALRTSSTGMISVETVVLIPPDEIDHASHLDVAYTPPGG